MINQKVLIISPSGSISEAIELISQNGIGLVFVVNSEKKVVGVVSEGDVSRSIEKGLVQEDAVEKAMNTNFLSVTLETSREQVLKILDNKIHAVPLLDEEGHLVEVYTKNSFPLKREKQVVARSRSPVRVSFGGGGSDLTYYFTSHGGAVLNTTICNYANAILRKRQDQRIIFRSYDLDAIAEYESFNELRTDCKLGLFSSLIKIIKPDFGFELEVFSDFEPRSGLGGSSAILSAIIGCFNQFREDPWTQHEIAELAFQAERLTLNIPGGWQDQYATVFGGFNFMEFSEDENIVHALRVSKNILSELEGSLLLCHIGGEHDSGEIHLSQKKNLLSSRDHQFYAQINKELTYEMKNYLLRGNLRQFGSALDKAWGCKQKFSEQISNGSINEAYEFGKEHGAIGGKLLGAGGGGYFLYMAGQDKIFGLRSALSQRFKSVQQITLDQQGMTSWKIRA